HVILKAAINQRRSDRGHRVHGISVRCNARDFLLDEMKITERFVELFSRVCVFDRQTQTSLGRARATRAECCASEIENRQRYFQTLPYGPRIFSFGTLTLRNANRPVAVPRIPIFGIRASSISKP